MGDHTTEEKIIRHDYLFDSGRIELANVLAGNPFILGNENLARFVTEIETRNLAAQTLGHKMELDTFFTELEGIEIEELPQDLLGRQANGFEQRGDWHLAATVDAEKQSVLWVKLEVQPRAAIRNHPCRKKKLARAVRLATIMFKEHARRPVQLRNNHPLRAIDNERTRCCHQGNFAHVDFLLLDFLDGVRRFPIKNDQADF